MLPYTGINYKTYVSEKGIATIECFIACIASNQLSFLMSCIVQLLTPIACMMH